MTIIFICGSLELGKDGVGDYTRRLAGELIRMGHKCGIIALMDKFAPQIKNENQFDGNESITCIRMPYQNGYRSNCKAVKNWVDNINPDLISIQYVPFSFNKKGLPFWMANSIITLLDGRSLNIMFHELWLGMEKETTIKYYLWGILQKKIIRSFNKYSNINSVHTHNNLYLFELKKIGFKAQLLPLFSNINVIEEYYKKRKDERFLLASLLNKGIINFIIFGEIHFGAPVELFAKEVFDFAKENNLAVRLLMIGKCGNESQIWQNIWELNELNIENLGWQSSEDIFKLLLGADIGITTTPLVLVDKSGSTAAMLAAMLPVICVARVWRPRLYQNIPSPEGIYEYKEGNFKKWIGKVLISNSTTKRDVRTIAMQFFNNNFL